MAKTTQTTPAPEKAPEQETPQTVEVPKGAELTLFGNFVYKSQ
jgi:hypothetical protein